MTTWMPVLLATVALAAPAKSPAPSKAPVSAKAPAKSGAHPVAPDLFDRLADTDAKPYRVYGQGIITDASHPKRPGDVFRADVLFRLQVSPELGEAVFAVDSGDSANRTTDRYYLRRGRLFQLDERDREIAATDLGDVDAATIAALHPALVAAAVCQRRESLRPLGPDRWELAWNDALWTLRCDAAKGQITSLERRIHHDLRGDGTETITFAGWEAGVPRTGHTVVTAYGREVARLDFESAGTDTMVAVPMGGGEANRARRVAAGRVLPHEIAPHLYTIDLDSLNTRVVVAEFADHLAVLEGAYNSENCDRIAVAVKARLAKPVRWFAFSHIHGQYVGGTRSWVHEGATVLVPPSSAPLVEEVVNARYDLHPDALARDPKPLKLETVKDHLRLEDSTNVLDVYNIDSSQHTDEYLLFYFPQQKVLLTGDLLFYRPGKPLVGRSKKLCDTVRDLKLDVDRYVATWPLSGYGTKNVVTKDEMTQACAAGK
jgi:glyoxylase-like metal-dependent hydrolase (beta-lactamase superfamily II)